MLVELINNPDLKKYITVYERGQTLFLEGDNSQDLFILVSGELDVLKGKNKIAGITDPGSFFGEMSFFLGARRTSTVKALSDVKTICIPKEHITAFLNEFPDVAQKITRLLAQRLEETSQVLYGFKEFCDQLPDAVIMTGRDDKILSCNKAAEKLYGMDYSKMRTKSVADIYEEPQVYEEFLKDVQENYSVREKVLKIRHPELGVRCISTSTTVLYDGHHNFQGVLSLGRDVTSVHNLERRYRMIRYWLLPCFVLLCLLGAALFYGYPHFSRGYQSLGTEKMKLRNQLANDYLVLKSLLIGPVAEEDGNKIDQVIKEFFSLREPGKSPYDGIVVLDTEKKVRQAYSINAGTQTEKMAGTSYSGISFQGSEDSLHRVLALYRTDKSHPLGHRGIEIAFIMRKDDNFLGWLVFQMNVELLEKTYGVTVDDLKKFTFTGA